MAQVLIVGYGNPLRGDDGVGWRAAESLMTILDRPDVEIRTGHQLTPELAEDASRARLAVFIDAACHNRWGEIASRKVEPDRSPSELFTHRLTPEVLLGLAERLYGAYPEGILFSVGGVSFEHGDVLSPEVRTALPALVEQVQTLCEAHLRAHGNSYHS